MVRLSNNQTIFWDMVFSKIWGHLHCAKRETLKADGFLLVYRDANALLKVLVAQSCLTHGLEPPHQASEFSRPEYWSGLPIPSPGDLPNPGVEPRSPTLQMDSLLSEPPGKPYLYFNMFSHTVSQSSKVAPYFISLRFVSESQDSYLSGGTVP